MQKSTEAKDKLMAGGQPESEVKSPAAPQSKKETPPPDPGQTYDCIILGGGPAGLSAALYLGRLRRSVLVVDDHEGRSTWHQVNRNYLGFPEGVHATALRELGERQAAEYGTEFLDGCASSASYEGEGRERIFTVLTSKGPFKSRTLIIAMGVSDRFPEFEGSADCIGKTMFWCLICDGYEAIDKKVVVLGHGSRAAALSLQLLKFTDDVTMVAWDEKVDLPQERLDALKEHNIRVLNDCDISYNCPLPGQLASITVGSGEEVKLDRLFVAQWIEPNTQIAKELGIKLDEHGCIMADAEQATNIGGVYAAGDLTRLFNHQVTSAVHEGGMAAAGVNYYLYEDWQKD